MKLKNAILLFAGITALLVPQVPAEEEGFTFTEEEVAQFEEEARKLESILHNEAEYKRACALEYNRIIMTVGNCFRAFRKSVDPAECIDERPLAAIHKQYADVLISQFGVDPATGTINQGAFTRANLAKAKPFLSPATYATIDANMTRAEIMLKFYMGGFAKGCALLNRDFYVEVQTVARLKLYLESSEAREVDAEYMKVWEFFHNKRAVDNAGIESVIKPSSPPHENAINFLTAYGKNISTSERNEWYQDVCNRLPNNYPLRYVNMREEGCTYTTEAFHLLFYEGMLRIWPKERTEEAMEYGKSIVDVFNTSAFTSEFKAYTEAAENGPKDIYTQTYHQLNSYVGSQASQFAELLCGLDKYLKDNTKFLANQEKSKGRTVLDNAKDALNELRSTLKRLLMTAVDEVPKNHPAANYY